MSNELVRYIAEQAGGLLIAVILIMRIEVKLDGLTGEIARLADTLTGQILINTQNHTR
ncbi:YvrJ family protein [Limosilactobacillus oris]|uniref:YvrJ family protein n=1 Tax=Limosilactobacillus oris TaxID=1632 RepID=UPI0018831FD9|nr:YvrJ family protein [Limosilactobacillus oris]MBF0601878.1 YvrJ family protein [Limosilactobacillus oris]